jgi:hypothetical protein
MGPELVPAPFLCANPGLGIIPRVPAFGHLSPPASDVHIDAPSINTTITIPHARSQRLRATGRIRPVTMMDPRLPTDVGGLTAPRACDMIATCCVEVWLVHVRGTTTWEPVAPWASSLSCRFPVTPWPVSLDPSACGIAGGAPSMLYSRGSDGSAKGDVSSRSLRFSGAVAR